MQKNTTAKTIQFTSEVVDRLGLLKAQMADLKKEAAALEAILKTTGDGEYDGKLFHAVVSTFEKTTVDYKGICKKLKASDYMLKTYSKTAISTTLRVSAHKK